MAVTTEEILAAARELAGRAMTDGEEKILSVLCASPSEMSGSQYNHNYLLHISI